MIKCPKTHKIHSNVWQKLSSHNIWHLKNYFIFYISLPLSYFFVVYVSFLFFCSDEPFYISIYPTVLLFLSISTARFLNSASVQKQRIHILTSHNIFSWLLCNLLFVKVLAAKFKCSVQRAKYFGGIFVWRLGWFVWRPRYRWHSV